MKKVLILVVSADIPPYDKMIQTSLQTWDSINIEHCETVFYCGASNKTNTDKIIYLPVKESLHSMGYKMLIAFDWALKNKEFDYIARVNSSCYVNKKELIKHIQTLPDKNIFAGLKVNHSYNQEWLWGGGQFIFSKDVIKELLINKSHWDHDLMEDVAVSFLANKIGIPFTDGKACSIDKNNEGWQLTSYGSESFRFTDFKECAKSNHFFYRVKQDYDRNQDAYIMNQLFENL